MESTQLATAPNHSVTVMASAGTGKTWLLVTRLIRLLIEGISPDSILAITFTRKAAAEMAARLTDRLYGLSNMDASQREQALLDMGVKATEAQLHTAANLYEKYLFEPHPIRVTTFHAFCQELLRRFPLEADVPAGFEILESAGLLEETAWDALVDEATRSPDGPIAADLEALFQNFNGHYGTKTALMQFLNHRSDWWAYTHNQTDPGTYAGRVLATQLNITSDLDPLIAGLTPSRRAELKRYAEMLARHGTATFVKAAELIGQALTPDHDSEAGITYLSQALLKKSTTPKPSKALVKSLGEEGQSRLLSLHLTLSAWCEDIQDQYRKRNTLVVSQAWFRVGSRLLDHFQRIKLEQRLLDFSDLEWKAYLLLNHGDHALWVQYKLDQRIDHLLIDEFQDTNPTQWHLIFPLLEELASATGQRQRTVFLVGDAKQSIYRFRRAEPDLFPAAQQWLRQRLHAVDHTLSTSWRSSLAIMEFVNALFGRDPSNPLLDEFAEHTTHRHGLWGQVEVLPLVIGDSNEPSTATTLRNPLHEPRMVLEDRRHHNEGELIAARIKGLLEQHTIIADGAEARPIRYDDIMILVRHRTHIHAYEEALRAAGIPYITASRGTLLDCIEISDVVALLDILIAPYNNLNLAVVLRSPLFDCSDADLMTLAAEPGAYWLDRLTSLASRLPPGSPLARAAHWLPRWQGLVGQRPVHDLLDRIYSEGNLIARYEAALPEHLRPRVRANLTRFIELALETDSGRYPSLTTFLQRLAIMRSQDHDAPDEAAETAATGSVRLLTIHAAKGLEAPAVFIADSAFSPQNRRAYQSLINWPAHAAKPSHFLLCGKPSEADRVTSALLEEEGRQERREQLNLLYVAVTRAKQLLFISGCKPNRGDELGWYGIITAQLGGGETIQQQGWCYSTGTQPTASPHAPPPVTSATIDPRLSGPIPPMAIDVEIAPSHSSDDASPEVKGDEAGRERGRAIHRFLQLLSDVKTPDSAAIRRQVVTELALEADAYPVAEWLAEAERVLNHPDLQAWFDPASYVKSFKEVPIYYYRDAKLVHGIIDRLIITEDRCVLIDYKTHRAATLDNLAAMAAPYHDQLEYYVGGVKKLWPGKKVQAFLLFTACAGVYTWQ